MPEYLGCIPPLVLFVVATFAKELTITVGNVHRHLDKSIFAIGFHDLVVDVIVHGYISQPSVDLG